MARGEVAVVVRLGRASRRGSEVDSLQDMANRNGSIIYLKDWLQ